MGIYLSSPKTEKASEDGGNGKLRYGLSSMQGWRTSMEDAVNVYPSSVQSIFTKNSLNMKHIKLGICAKLFRKFFSGYSAYLFEFVGLASHSMPQRDIAQPLARKPEGVYFLMDEVMCSQRAQMELREMEDKAKLVSDVVEELLGSPRKGELTIEANGGSLEEGSHCDFEGPTAGSTACVAIIRDNKLIVANAGDSRCVISRRGQAHDLSRDHKPDLEEERERILKAGGFIQGGRVNGSLNLARAIGDMEFKKRKDLSPEKQMVTANPDVKILELCDDDEFLVLACDGIWDCMSSQQVVDFIRDQLKSEEKLSVICQRVMENCLAPSAGGEGCDNMTMILVQLNNKT